ncbi:TetR/AcrR family transcriptional regulator [Acinetobacter sp. ANC 3903]|uniref:TetR/AcrR family transcriptional regulator n=1 Tax=Acinetobacter sp. ANC 3903 TaxID=1977883 RepID=UPI001D17B5D7|nr:TetR/AcrR family transcriptional regulator [Acinetobacter sp. ANC 3903]
MNLAKQQRHLMNIHNILEAAEQIIIESEHELVVLDLAKQVDLAKGTVYKYFKSKNQLYLEILIKNEKRLLEISIQHDGNIHKFLSTYMKYHLYASLRTIKFHHLEEKITNKERNLNALFQELYAIREKRIVEMKDITAEHLKRVGSGFSVRDYFSYIWSITYGAALLISSNNCKLSVLNKEKLINFYIDQVMNI